MILRPDLTEEQQAKFENIFNEIIKQAPEEIQQLWAKDSSIYWPTRNEYIIANNIHLKLPRPLADKYNSLSNKVKDRTL